MDVHVRRLGQVPEEVLESVGIDALAESENGRVTGPFDKTDLGNAMRFVAEHGDDLRYVYPWNRWLVYDGKRWAVDDTGEVERRAKAVVREMYHEADPANGGPINKELAKHAIRSQSRSRIESMIALARSEPGIPVTPEELDADPWALNTENGTIDLRTGDRRDHRREDLITKIAPVEYDPNAAAPTWEACLEKVLPSETLRWFFQKANGYSATGDTCEQCMFINYGTGANGKTTVQEALREALGDYALRAPTEMLMAKPAGGVPNDVARLKGARFVTASETEDGRRLAESLIKDLTGQDAITARFMRAEFFDFKPTHKLWLSTNHKPVIKGTDNAIWRRIRLVPFTVTIPKEEQDPKLPEKLRAELPGILTWIVRGCSAWLEEGLQAPEEVRQATGEYRAEMDVMAAFIREECLLADYANATANALYQAYREWCEETGERAESQRKFGERLRERGFDRRRITSGANKGKYEYLGIGLAHGTPPPDDPRSGEPSGDSRPSGEHSGKETFTDKNASKSQTNGPTQTSRSEQSEPKSDINARKNAPRVETPEKGSLHSLPSPSDGLNQVAEVAGLEKCIHDVPGGCYLCRGKHDEGGAA